MKSAEVTINGIYYCVSYYEHRTERRDLVTSHGGLDHYHEYDDVTIEIVNVWDIEGDRVNDYPDGLIKMEILNLN